VNLLITKLKQSRINRIVWPEAKQFAWQAWLGLKKTVGEDLLRLFFRLIVNALIRESLDFLMNLLSNLS